MKRIDEIKQAILFEGKVFVNDLSQKYQVSEVSIRKDLTILEKQGFARKFYGGATRLETDKANDDNPTDFYQDPLLIKLAERACREIQDGDCIFLGSGRTCCILARKLEQFKNLTVVTNNISALNDLLGRVTKVYLIGGEVTSTDQMTMFSSWDQPQSFTDNIYVNKAFTSISGLDLKAGLTVNSVISTYVYRHISAMAHRWYLMADSSKFDRIAIYPVAELSQIHAIISESIPTTYRQFFTANNVQILLV
ncbi:MAG: DeoR/GlpR family DNA-binding transcription regulator [Eubacteriales bacterium]|nr:DeoR/GlpR family DNA-binding transcription regulator [Eubacteriales bacterium]